MNRFIFSTMVMQADGSVGAKSGMDY